MKTLEQKIAEVKRYFPITPKKKITSVVVVYKKKKANVINETAPFIEAGYKHVAFKNRKMTVLCASPVEFSEEDVEYFESCSSTQRLEGEVVGLAGTIHLYKNI